MPVTTIYGIKNCDTVKKARRWLETNGVEYQFHDFRVDGLDAENLAQWESQLSWEVLLNKRSTTWKNLPAPARENLDRQAALCLLAKHPTLIKRPVLCHQQQVHVGFSEAVYESIFNQCN
jgi:Spx/MgsR family transcriptional regulator